MGALTVDLKDLKLPALERILKELEDKSGPRWVAAGILGGATNEDGESVAEYAAYNEFGTTKIPKRPFLRTTMAKNGEKYAALLKGALKGLAASGSSEPVGMALTAVGREELVTMQEGVKTARKEARPGGGYSGTLFDTGTMLGSVAFELLNSNEEPIA